MGNWFRQKNNKKCRNKPKKDLMNDGLFRSFLLRRGRDWKALPFLFLF
jgi:hypothetical protein